MFSMELAHTSESGGARHDDMITHPHRLALHGLRNKNKNKWKQYWRMHSFDSLRSFGGMSCIRFYLQLIMEWKIDYLLAINIKEATHLLLSPPCASLTMNRYFVLEWNAGALVALEFLPELPACWSQNISGASNRLLGHIQPFVQRFDTSNCLRLYHQTRRNVGSKCAFYLHFGTMCASAAHWHLSINGHKFYSAE